MFVFFQISSGHFWGSISCILCFLLTFSTMRISKTVLSFVSFDRRFIANPLNNRTGPRQKGSVALIPNHFCSLSKAAIIVYLYTDTNI